MDIDKKKSKFYVPEPRWKPEMVSGRQIFSGLTIILVACVFAVFVQKGIDGNGEPSILGFVSMWVVGIAVAYSLERVISNLFFPKNRRMNDDISEISEKSALELQKELENTFYEKRSEDQSFSHIVNADQISEGDVPDMDKATLPKTGSAEELRKRLETPEAKERLAERLTNHLIRVGQIKVSPEEAKNLSPEGKKALGEYLERTGQLKSD